MASRTATPTLLRACTAELLGTAFLTATVVGSGIAATRLSPSDTGLELLENALITGAALIALILALQPISAAFNPVVTIIEWAFGRLDALSAAALTVSQVIGAVAGAVAANLMFGLSAISISAHARSGASLWFAEVIATLGLILVVFGMLHSRRTDYIALAVGAYITAAYWFTSSTSFANPAVTIGRIFSDTFAGIAPRSVAMFVLMQLIGGTLAFVLVRVLYVDAAESVGDLMAYPPPEGTPTPGATILNGHAAVDAGSRPVEASGQRVTRA
jgi:glycerol uptake facilitator-like aquaporin